MKIHTFTADSAADAVAQIRAQLGSAAIVLNVRQLPTPGISRLWQKPRIEVVACLPSENAPKDEPVAESRRDLAEVRTETPTILEKVVTLPSPVLNETRVDAASFSKWRVGRMLEQTGILPVYAQQIVDALHARHGENPPESLSKELGLTRTILADCWQQRAVSWPSGRLHVLVGAPGAGKTTLLCKWLARAVLVEGHSARVWRLDGRRANTAESLSVYGDILGVPVERRWSSTDPESLADVQFVDLPGVDWSDASAVSELGNQIDLLPSPQVHLVLNAAYETPLLLAQARAFAALPVVAISFTHLDEEPRRAKLWNLLLGTNYSVRFLSGGQNVPGDFQEASAGSLLERFIPCK